MVTIHDVNRTIKEYYSIYGSHTVDDLDLTVRAHGHVILRKNRPNLGVKFSQITGDYGAHRKGLQSLQGLPEQVGGDLMISGNELENLLGAPKVVRGSMDITHMQHTLKNLAGMPERIEGVLYVTYDPQLPLLRSLAASAVVLRQAEYTSAKLFEAQTRCEEILNNPQWIGKGKRYMLNCALELKKAGLGGNAAW